MKKLLSLLFLAVAIGSLSAFCWLYDRVRTYERAHGVAILSTCACAPSGTNATCAAKGTAPSSDKKAAAESVAETSVVPLSVTGVEYDGQTRLEVRLSAKPDTHALYEYVSVEPMNSARVKVRYTDAYDWETEESIPKLVVTGDFPHDTNVTLTVRRGLARDGHAADANHASELKADYTYVFRRGPLPPSVAFAHTGRYLPPLGEGALAVKALNITNVSVRVHRLVPENVVQLLAREERRYNEYYSGNIDVVDTIELTSTGTVSSVRCRNERNREETVLAPVRCADGGPARGTFLVEILSADREPDASEYIWRNGSWCYNARGYNPGRYRLVCVSDLGLNVRQTTDGVGVWVTSFSTGRPVAGARVEVYAASRLKLREGVTDANGWCATRAVAGGEPFAVIVRTADGSDMTFLALSSRMRADETPTDGAREEYLAPEECTGFAWTERGIYRHGEKILFHVLLRNGRRVAPKPFPVALRLLDTDGKVVSETTALPDARGSLVCDRFAVSDDLPSGCWHLQAKIPGKNGKVLAETEVKVEEFAPPQIRVKVTASENVAPSNFTFAVAAEHLFGGPAASLACGGAVVFEDAPFAPQGWKGWTFGNEKRALKPSFRELCETTLDADGKAVLIAPIFAQSGLPRAAVKATAQGVVFEDGGRPATGRASAMLHYFPYYIGSTLSGWLRRPAAGKPEMAVACVTPAGAAVKEPKRLVMKLERIDSVYSYKKNEDGWNTWQCEHIPVTIADDVEVMTTADGRATVALPTVDCGDYFVSLTDPVSGTSFGRTFYLSDWGDGAVRAPLANPTEIAIRTDRRFYRVGETPRLLVKAPFAGAALLTVLRERELYTEVIALTNATSEITLRPVTAENAPNLDVSLTVVQRVSAGTAHFAARAQGQATISVRPLEDELAVSLKSEVTVAKDGGSTVTVDVSATGAAASDATAVVTLVDEGINLLTGEKTPDPIGVFAKPRTSEHPLFDLYAKLLPVLDGGLKVNGVKTGGGFGAEMLSRVSPVGTRRFKPLALWQTQVPLTGGRGRATFSLPEFAGEVRVTAVAFSERATGAASAQVKVVPKLILVADAPRFVAPGDRYAATATVRNRSGAAGAVTVAVNGARQAFALAEGASTNIVLMLDAPAAPCEGKLVVTAEGLGERHVQELLLPVRPAVAWVSRAGVSPEGEWRAPTDGKCSTRIYDSPLGDYAAALNWLAEYRHGCLEQTCSRVFPLIAAGGVLNALVTNRADAVARGVRRVESMMRYRDFTMWPDCDYTPWDREVSLYAAHFLVAAEKAGTKLSCRRALLEYLKAWVRDEEPEIASYAALSLALAGKPDRDRMFRLYDERAKLSALSRARLACAFAEIADLARAKALLADAFEPQSVREAAFVLMALIAVDPADARILPLVMWLNAKRDRARHCWGTTSENAHALLAIGAWAQANPPKKGERFVAWRHLTLPKPEEVKAENEGLFVTRRFRRADGTSAPLEGLRPGQLVLCEIAITSSVTRVVNDLVIEDLLPAAFDPVHREIAVPDAATAGATDIADWVMRRDLRDDRMLVFSKKFTLEAGHVARFVYPVRVVSAGDYVLPGTSVEGMYDPALRARLAPGRIVVRP